MKLVVFGASGGIGQHLVRLAGLRGDEVRAVYRTPSPIAASSHYTPIVAPTVVDTAVIAETIIGADAVMVALGLRRRQPGNPWSRVTSPPDLTSRFAAHLVAVMQRPFMPQTVVAISAAGVGDSAAAVHPVLRWLFQTSLIGRAYADLARMEQVYRDSHLRWLCVRPTTLTDRAGPPRPACETRVYGLMSRIARIDVAHYLLDRVHDAVETPWRSPTPMITGC